MPQYATIADGLMQRKVTGNDGQTGVPWKRYNFLLSLLLFPWYNFLLSKRVEKKFEQDWQNSSCFLTVCFQLVHLFNFSPLCVLKQNSWYSLPQLLLQSVLWTCTFVHSSSSFQAKQLIFPPAAANALLHPLRRECRHADSECAEKLTEKMKYLRKKRTSMHRISQVWVTEKKPKIHWRRWTNWEKQSIKQVWVEWAKN